MPGSSFFGKGFRILLLDPHYKPQLKPLIRCRNFFSPFETSSRHLDRTVDDTLTTTGLPWEPLSTRFPDGAGSSRQSDHTGFVDFESGAGAYRGCSERPAHTSGRFARYSADSPPPCGLGAGRVCIRSSDGEQNTHDTCVSRSRPNPLGRRADADQILRHKQRLSSST